MTRIWIFITTYADESRYVMKFDCIIQNPPYKRGLHLKILAEAIKHLKNTGSIISLQPIVKWKESVLFDSSLPVDNTCVLDRYTMDESSKLFNSHQRCDLGLVSIGKTSCTLVDNIGTLQKMKAKLKKAISVAGLIGDKLEDDYNDLVVVRKSLDAYLHPEEYNIINKTIAKYENK